MISGKKKAGAKGPERCIALRQVWEEHKRRAEDGEEGAVQYCTLTMGSLPDMGYRHSEGPLCLWAHTLLSL